MRQVVDMMKNLSLNLLSNAQNGHGHDRPSNQANRDGMTRNSGGQNAKRNWRFPPTIITMES